MAWGGWLVRAFVGVGVFAFFVCTPWGAFLSKHRYFSGDAGILTPSE